MSGEDDDDMHERTSTPYLDALVRFRDGRKPTRLMVPGHKGGRAISARLSEALGADAGKVLGLDVPLHVRGIDVEPPDPPPIDRAQTLAAEAWGARKTHFVVGGASQANHIACLALSLLSGDRRPRVAVQRNAHQSVIYGLILADAEVIWLNPEIDAEFGIQHGVTPQALDGILATLDGDPLDAVMVVSPTYHGAVSDVSGLAETIDRRRPAGQTLLVVDEAWGAHFPFNERFPTTAVRSGADIVVSSTHKILGSLTQSAMLHITEHVLPMFELPVEQAIDRARNLVKTTSPSALLTASLDAARAYARGEGATMLGLAAENADSVRAAARNGDLPGVEAVDESIVEPNASVVAFDPLRVTLDVRGTGLTGRQVQDELRKPDAGGIEIEFVTDELIVLLFGIGDGDPDSARTVIAALSKLPLRTPPAASATACSTGSERQPTIQELFGRIDKPKIRNTPREGYLGLRQTRRLEDSEGWICAEIVAPYPPGIAVVMPGELLTREIVAYLLRIRNDVEFADCLDTSLKQIQVLTGGGTIEQDRTPPIPGRTPPTGSQADAS